MSLAATVENVTTSIGWENMHLTEIFINGNLRLDSFVKISHSIKYS